MIPASILSKLATEEGIAELEDALAIKDNSKLTNTLVYRGGITASTLNLNEHSLVTAKADKSNLGIRLEIPSNDGGISTTVIEIKIPTSEFMVLQEAMFDVLLFRELVEAAGTDNNEEKW